MKNLYSDLMTLVSDPLSGFLYRDIAFDNLTYRVFDYNLVSWSTWTRPNAINCRGTMFCGETLVSLPPPKFFNYHEGNVDHIQGKVIADIMEKMDGSLISTYLHRGALYLKSKGHIFSEQAVRANKLLDKAYPELKKELVDLAQKGYTVNMEYTAPDNIIVVFYPREELTVLSIRSMATGEMHFGSDIVKNFQNYPHIQKNLVQFDAANIESDKIEDYILEVIKQTVGEGKVLQIKSATENYLVKIKNERYTLLHHTKNDMDSPRKILECIVAQKLDDLKGLFIENPEIIKYLEEFENRVIPVINQIKSQVQDYYEQNKHLDKKSYVIKAQPLLGPQIGLAIEAYLGYEITYNDFIIKHRKRLFPEIEFTDVVKTPQMK